MSKTQEIRTKNESLFSLVATANSISQLLQESGGEITPDIEALMVHVDVSLPAKIDGYKVAMERLDIEAKYWNDKAKMFAAIGRAHTQLSDRLSDSLKEAIKALGVDEVKGNDYRFKLSNVKPSLVIDGTTLDPSYITTVLTVVPDKERIRSALEVGATIKGAKLVQGVSLRSYVNKRGA